MVTRYLSPDPVVTSIFVGEIHRMDSNPLSGSSPFKQPSGHDRATSHEDCRTERSHTGSIIAAPLVTTRTELPSGETYRDSSSSAIKRVSTAAPSHEAAKQPATIARAGARHPPLTGARHADSRNSASVRSTAIAMWRVTRSIIR